MPHPLPPRRGRVAAVVVVSAALTAALAIGAAGTAAPHAAAPHDVPAPAAQSTNLGSFQLVDGHFPQNWSWRQSHDQGTGSLKLTANGGPAAISHLWAHNIEDGLQPREVGFPSNTGSFTVTDTLMTDIRDDSVEDDNFMPGTISNSLFDGVYAFLSEQQQTAGAGNNTIGPGEDRFIHLRNVAVRLHSTNTDPGTGHLVKFQPRGATNHSLDIADSVFATDAAPVNGWKNFTFPAGTRFSGTNFILWLGAPGGYGGGRPAGVTFLEGAAAVQKWNTVRNAWYTAHGFPAKAAADLDPAAWSPTQPGRTGANSPSPAPPSPDTTGGAGATTVAGKYGLVG